MLTHSNPISNITSATPNHNHWRIIMGLKDQPEHKATPAFETQAETAANATAAEAAVASAEKATTAEKAAADVAATKAIAVAATTAVGAAKPPVKFQIAFAEFKDVFDTPTVEALGLGTPRIKGEQGAFFNEAVELGSEIRFELISWNHRWVCGTGEDDKEAKDFFRVSFDNQTISGSGEDFHAYLEALKAQGFNKARISQYGDMFGFITWTNKSGDIAPDQRQMVCLQASPTSLGAFTSFCVSRGMLQSKGIAAPTDLIEIHCEKRAKGDNKYTNYSWHVPTV